MEWLAAQRFQRGVVMVQHEFAEKLASMPGDEHYRAVSALAHYCFRITRVALVDRKSFSPPPAVESAVLVILPVNRISKRTVRGLNLLFSSRNRKASSVAARFGILGYENEERRIDQLPPATLVQMAEMLHDLQAF